MTVTVASFHTKRPATSSGPVRMLLFLATPPVRVLEARVLPLARSNLAAVGFVLIVGVAFVTVTQAKLLFVLAFLPLSLRMAVTSA